MVLVKNLWRARTENCEILSYRYFDSSLTIYRVTATTRSKVSSVLMYRNFQEDGMLNTSAESGTSGRRSSTGAARKKSLKGQNKPKAYKLGETAPMNVSLWFQE